MLPYNYLIDSRIRDSMSLSLSDSIIIFDEAHNIEKLSEEGCSFTISLRDLENCESDFKLIRQKIKHGEECKLKDEDVDALEAPIECLAHAMAKMKREFDNERKQSTSSFQ